jgi:hypothetical protein
VKKAILIGADAEVVSSGTAWDRLFAEGGLGALSLSRFLRQLLSVLKNTWQKSYYLGKPDCRQITRANEHVSFSA